MRSALADQAMRIAPSLRREEIHGLRWMRGFVNASEKGCHFACSGSWCVVRSGVTDERLPDRKRRFERCRKAVQFRSGTASYEGAARRRPVAAVGTARSHTAARQGQSELGLLSRLCARLRRRGPSARGRPGRDCRWPRTRCVSDADVVRSAGVGEWRSTVLRYVLPAEAVTFARRWNHVDTGETCSMSSRYETKARRSCRGLAGRALATWTSRASSQRVHSCSSAWAAPACSRTRTINS